MQIRHIRHNTRHTDCWVWGGFHVPSVVYWRPAQQKLLIGNRRTMPHPHGGISAWYATAHKRKWKNWHNTRQLVKET